MKRIVLLSVLCTLLSTVSTMAWNKYAEFTEADGTLTFYQDNSSPGSHGGVAFTIPNANETPGWQSEPYKTKITRVVFEAFGENAPIALEQTWPSMKGWFREMKSLKTVESHKKTVSGAIHNAGAMDPGSSMAEMFFGCTRLESVDLSNLSLSTLFILTENYKGVEDMSDMFNSCYALKEAKFYAVKNVKKADRMFYHCDELFSLDLFSFNTSNLTSTISMFAQCNKLERIHVNSEYDFSKVKTSGGMFLNCVKLKGRAGTTYDASHTDVEYARIDGIDGSGYLTPEVYVAYEDTTLSFYCDIYRMLRQKNYRVFTTSKLSDGSFGKYFSAVYGQNKVNAIQLDASIATAILPPSVSLENWFKELEYTGPKLIKGLRYINTEYIEDMSGMFMFPALEKLDLTGFDTRNVKNMRQMFKGCASLKSLDLSGFNTAKVTDMREMFCKCQNLENVNLSSFNTAKVTDMNKMFYQCESLEDLDLSGFDTRQVEQMDSMFADCKKLKSDFSTFQSYWMTSIAGMFMNCSSLTLLDLRNFSTGYVTDMSRLFYGCSSLNSIYVNGDRWHMDKVQKSNYMFSGCTSLVGGMGTKYSALHADGSYARVDKGTSEPGYFTEPRGYQLYIGGTQVTDENKKDILGDGRFSFDHVSSTLTVRKGAKDDISAKYTAPSGKPVIESAMNLKIYFQDNATFRSDNDVLRLGSNVTISSKPDKYLELYPGTNRSGITNLSTHALMLTVDSVNLYSGGGKYGFHGLNTGSFQKVTFQKDATFQVLNATTAAMDGCSLTLNDGLSIIDPYGGTVKDGTLYLSDGTTVAKGLYIGKRVESYSLYINGKQVTVENKADILGDGTFSYNPGTKTLTIKKSYTSTNGIEHIIRNSYIKGLIINVPGNVTLTSAERAIQDVIALGSNNTTITGGGTLKVIGRNAGCIGVKIGYKATLTVTDVTLEAEGGFGLSGDDVVSNLVVSNATVKAKCIATSNPEAIHGFSSVTLNGVDVVSPSGGYVTDDGKFVDASGNVAAEVTIGTKTYDLSIGGTKVTTANKDNILGDGKFSYDAVKNVLTVSGSLDTNENGIDNRINGLTVYVPKDATISTGGSMAAIVTTKNLTVTGPGLLTLRSEKDCGIFVKEGATLRIEDANVDAQGGWPLAGYNSTTQEKLEIVNSTVKAKSAEWYGIADFYGGVTLDGCHIAIPEGGYFKNGQIVTASGGVAKEVEIVLGSVVDYDLWVGGKRVTTLNQSDILGNGRFTYLPDDNALVVNGDLKTESQTGITTQIDGLTIYVAKNATIETNGIIGIEVKSNTTISGPGLLIVRAGNECAIGACNDVCLTLDEANVDVEGYWGIAGWNQSSHESLKVINSTVKAVSTGSNFSAISFFCGGITLDGCEVLMPESSQVSYGNIVDKDGKVAKEVRIMPVEEAYAVYDNGTLTFYCDKQKSSHPGTKYALNSGRTTPEWNNTGATSVVFDPSFALARPTTTYSWFLNMNQLETITGLENLNTSEVTDMKAMFMSCPKLTSLDLSGFNTENVTDMTNMFADDRGLKSVNVSSFNTAKVTAMGTMFSGCRQLERLDVSKFNTKNVTDMSTMFSYCEKLTTLDLSSFNTENVTKMLSMFKNCSALQSLDLSSFNTAKVTTMKWMFYECTSLKTVYAGEGWSIDMEHGAYDEIFYNCESIVGGQGTKYSGDHVAFAHIDGGKTDPGYFTDKKTINRADVNRDGTVDSADIVAVIKEMPDGDMKADVNNDGAIDSADIVAVIKAMK